MIKVYYGNNVNRQNDIADTSTTLRDFLDAHGVDYARGSVTLNGGTVDAASMAKSFADLGYDGQDGRPVFLLVVTKADNAA